MRVPAKKGATQRLEEVVFALVLPWILVVVVLACAAAHAAGWGCEP